MSSCFTKRMCEQDCLYLKRKVLSCKESFSFTNMGTKENKRIKPLQKETLQSFLLAYLLAIECFSDFFYARTIFKTFTVLIIKLINMNFTN